VNPRISPQQQAQLRSLTQDADELLRTCAIHGLALASIPQGEREAALIAIAETTAPETPPATAANGAAPASVAPTDAGQPQPDPRQKPETAVVECIRLLEAKEYKSFLQEFTPPDTLALLLSMPNMTIDDIAKEAGEKQLPELLQALKAIKDVKPEVSSDGQKATFTLTEPVAGHNSFSLVKIGKFWYMTPQ
jgi:hypothetical protein